MIRNFIFTSQIFKALKTNSCSSAHCFKLPNFLNIHEKPYNFQNVLVWLQGVKINRILTPHKILPKSLLGQLVQLQGACDNQESSSLIQPAHFPVSTKKTKKKETSYHKLNLFLHLLIIVTISSKDQINVLPSGADQITENRILEKAKSIQNMVDCCNFS